MSHRPLRVLLTLALVPAPIPRWNTPFSLTCSVHLAWLSHPHLPVFQLPGSRGELTDGLDDDSFEVWRWRFGSSCRWVDEGQKEHFSELDYLLSRFDVTGSFLDTKVVCGVFALLRFCTATDVISFAIGAKRVMCVWCEEW
jgi:hypothetical protein